MKSQIRTLYLHMLVAALAATVIVAFAMSLNDALSAGSIETSNAWTNFVAECQRKSGSGGMPHPLFEAAKSRGAMDHFRTLGLVILSILGVLLTTHLLSRRLQRKLVAEDPVGPVDGGQSDA